MPTPSNAPATTTGGPEIQNAQLFAELTERQQMPQISHAIQGLAKKQRLQIEKVGVISRARLLVKYKFKTKAGASGIVTMNPGFPWKMLSEIALQANGTTGIIDVGAVVLEQRRRRVYRNPVSAIFRGLKGGEKTTSATEYEGQFVVEIPIAHDMTSLIGSLLAQNEETTLSFLLTWASENELANSEGFLEKFEGEVEWGTSVFSIGSTVVGKEEKTVLPDLSAFHGLSQQELNLPGTGKRPAELVRTDGQLLCYTASVLNKVGGQEELSPQEWTEFKIEYGGNKDPLVWVPASELLEENADDYDGPLLVNGLHFLAIDNERDNAQRDMIIPQDLVELRAVLGIPTAFKPEEARILTTQETLYPAV
jgi:hypothetical protein